jgi:hypothetical protein
MPRKRSSANAYATLTKAFELSMAAPQVIALRSLMMLGPANAGTAQEMVRMSAEKVQAWQESMAAIGVQVQRAQLDAMRQWLSAWSAPWQLRLHVPGADAAKLQRTAAQVIHSGLAPVHRRATANARRLKRKKR